MNSRPRVFMVWPMMAMEMATGMRQARPSRALKNMIRAIEATGTSTVPARSGIWWATNEWVTPALSSMTLRMRPLVVVSKKPSGMATTLAMDSLRMLVSTRKATRCEHASEAK